jgi:amino acid adenylation domain-containing protein
MMHHSVDLLVAILGVMWAEAVYVPIDPEYPDERKKFLAADSGIRLVISDEADSRIPGRAVTVIQPDRLGTGPQPNSYRLVLDDLACVIYTSGSTGTPKGVMITHRGLVNLATAASVEFGLQPGDRYLMLAAASFSASLEELFPPLVQCAASIFPADRAGLSPVPALLDFLDTQEITLLELQTVHWHLLVRYLADTGCSLPSSLRLVIMGGDRAIPEIMEQWNRFEIPLIHVYGPTETTATATYWPVSAGQMPLDGVLSIGEAIAGTRMYVVDEQLALVASGAEGELLVGGDSLALGYLGLPEFTAQRFVADQYSGIPGARLYRTGDVVRRLPDGRLQFLGRGDQQVKIRGYRIEPREIETVLRRHPAVRQALVTARQDLSGEKHLVGYVAADKKDVDAQSIRSFLASELPAYMIPSAIVRVDEFPMSIHRKIDVAALPEPPKRRPNLTTTFVPPTGEIEHWLSITAARLLGLEEIGMLDEFLELGGDSLFVLRMISWIRAHLGITVGPREVFEASCVRNVASLLGASETAIIRPRERPQHLPLKKQSCE